MALYRALFVAPYPGLAEVARSAAEDFPEIDLTVHEGDLQEGLEAALRVFGSDFDVVISRGGTAQMLEDEFTVPVVEVSVSSADLLHGLAIHNPRGERCAVVGFSNTLKSVSQVADFSDFDLDVYSVNFDDELPLVLQDILAGNYSVVLCDNFAVKKCAELGIEAHLLESGPESVRDALERTLFFCQQVEALQDKNHVLWDILKSQSSSVTMFSAPGRLMYSNLEEGRSELLAFMREHLDDPAPAKLTLRRARKIYRLNMIRSGNGPAEVVSFSVSSSNIPSSENLVGIVRLNRDEVEKRYRASVYKAVGAGEQSTAFISRASRIEKPVMLEGEIGSGKAQIAALLYLNSNMKNRPFVVIDCSLLIDKSWDYLLNSTGSPLFGQDDTLYFKAAHALSDDRLRMLLDLIRRTGAAERCRLIFSANDDAAGGETAGIASIVEQLSCFVFTAPSLRKRADIAQAARLFVASEAQRMGIEPPTITDEAAEILGRHTWPKNYIELRQVMQRCMASSADIINAEIVHDALGREQSTLFSSLATPDASTSIELLRPLKDTEREIVQMVVKKLGGNQTEAARILGLSRTTIWRMLK
ncbi:PrpR N-terminal domain-containing protein [Paratractidigestivibacter sp.]|uniref:PrpR N-terminal domain-containing protein n=1 Tax=Paratractidigestivibacter sp. TaxID=2847316 RepID=UPI002ABDBB06|nr:PrpR N-terminal domain-containing protein [Paratractidigestivibacter sp.]